MSWGLREGREQPLGCTARDLFSANQSWRRWEMLVSFPAQWDTLCLDWEVRGEGLLSWPHLPRVAFPSLWLWGRWEEGETACGHKCGTHRYGGPTVFPWTLWCLRNCLPTWHESRFSVWQFLEGVQWGQLPYKEKWTEVWDQVLLCLPKLIRWVCTLFPGHQVQWLALQGVRSSKVGNLVIATCLKSHIKMLSPTPFQLTN